MPLFQDDCGCPLTPTQLEVLREANDIDSTISVTRSPGTITSGVALRRSVYDAVVQLSEVVSENMLKKLLPFLHCTAWDEVIEERYIGNPRLCGFPTCSEVVEKREKKQRYYIDREARKIYENRIVRDMYCSRLCMNRSSSVRAQLADEPLWISGNIKERISWSYNIDVPVGSNCITSENVGVEIVNAVEEKLTDLRIREVEESTPSSSDDDANETLVDFCLDAGDVVIDENKDSDNQKSQVFVAHSDLCGEKSDKKLEKKSSKSATPIVTANRRIANRISTLPHNPRLPDPQMSTNHSLTATEVEKLNRLRSKYSNYAVKKPIIIEPVQTTSYTTVLKKRGQTEQGRESTVGTMLQSKDIDKTVELVRSLFSGWITEHTLHLLRSGCPQVSFSSCPTMKFFRTLHTDDHVYTKEIFLPNVDSLDVRKKRLQIFLETVKKPMAKYQHQLKCTFSEFNWLFVIAATFNLEPDTITNFHMDTLKLVSIVLLKIISMVDNVLECSLFAEHETYEKFLRLLRELGVDKHIFDELVLDLVGDARET